MDFLTASEMNALYRSAKPDEALAAAAGLLATDPNCAEAHLTAGLIHLRRNEASEAIKSLKGCLASRPAEWILERMRQDFIAHQRPTIRREMAMKMGNFFRTHLPSLGPALAPEQRRASHDYVNVVGSSYVRSFGGSPALFHQHVARIPFHNCREPMVLWDAQL
jgi:hypothetical protein